MLRIAILDLYEGHANQGMRCLREILNQWGEYHHLQLEWDEFEVRQEHNLPDMSYDIYISSGGPGSPLDSIGSAWERAYFKWLEQVENWNADVENVNKKYVFFICHSFELVCRHYAIAEVTQRRSTSFGVFPVHVLPAGQADPVFNGLGDPFFVVDSRDWQVVHPDFEKLKTMGAQVLCIEKYRPHVPYAQAIMGVRFNEYMIGTQFHPEADAMGMSAYLQSAEKKEMVIKNYGEQKWHSMMEGLHDPGKIMKTYGHVLPNFLDIARHALAKKEQQFV